MVLLGPSPVPWAEIAQLHWLTFSRNTTKANSMDCCSKTFWLYKPIPFQILFLQSKMFGIQLPWNYSSALVRIFSSGKMTFHLFQRSFKTSQVDMENPDVFNSENWEIDFEQESYLVWCASSGRRIAEHSPVLCQAVIYMKISAETILGHLCRASGRSWRNQKKRNNLHNYHIFINY